MSTLTYPPLIYVSLRWNIQFTSKWRENLNKLNIIAENNGFLVPRPPLPVQGFRVTNMESEKPMEHMSGNIYCHFKPGEKTQFILDVPPHENSGEIRLNTSQYNDFDSFRSDIERIKNILCELDKDVMIIGARLYFVDAIIAAPNKTLKDYFADSYVAIPEVIQNSNETPLPSFTQNMSYGPDLTNSIHSGWEIRAQPFQNQNEKNGVNIFPVSLGENGANHSLTLSLSLGWIMKRQIENKPPDLAGGTHYGNIVFQASENYQSNMLLSFDATTEMKKLRDKCHDNFKNITSTFAQEEWK